VFSSEQSLLNKPLGCGEQGRAGADAGLCGSIDEG